MWSGFTGTQDFTHCSWGWSRSERMRLECPRSCCPSPLRSPQFRRWEQKAQGSSWLNSTGGSCRWGHQSFDPASSLGQAQRTLQSPFSCPRKLSRALPGSCLWSTRLQHRLCWTTWCRTAACCQWSQLTWPNHGLDTWHCRWSDPRCFRCCRRTSRDLYPCKRRSSLILPAHDRQSRSRWWTDSEPGWTLSWILAPHPWSSEGTSPSGFSETLQLENGG